MYLVATLRDKGYSLKQISDRSKISVSTLDDVSNKLSYARSEFKSKYNQVSPRYCAEDVSGLYEILEVADGAIDTELDNFYAIYRAAKWAFENAPQSEQNEWYPKGKCMDFILDLDNAKLRMRDRWIEVGARDAQWMLISGYDFDVNSRNAPVFANHKQ